MTFQAFDYAEKYNSPVMVLVDGFTATMMEPVILPEMRTQEQVSGMKQANAEKWALTGKPASRERRLISSNIEEDENIRSAALYDEWNENEVLVEEYMLDDAEVVIAAYGVGARISRSAIRILRQEGYKVGMIRPKTVYPYPYSSFERLDYNRVKAILDVEISIPAQMIEDVMLGVKGRVPIATCLRSCGEIISRDAIVEAAKMLCKGMGDA